MRRPPRICQEQSLGGMCDEDEDGDRHDHGQDDSVMMIVMMVMMVMRNENREMITMTSMITMTTMIIMMMLLLICGSLVKSY